MGFDLRRINPDLAERQERIAKEVCRLHSLPDRFLARALRNLGRKAREEIGLVISGADISGYDDLLLSSLTPLLARKLGEDALSEAEVAATRYMTFHKDPNAIRLAVGECFNNFILPQLAARARGSMPATEILSRSFVNGNPITSALDRVVPPRPDSQDWIATHMREISRVRFGHERWSAWQPEFNDWKRVDRSGILECLEADPGQSGVDGGPEM